MKLLFVLVFGILLVLVGCSQVEKPDSLTSETKIPTVVTRTPEPIPVPNTSLSELQKEINDNINLQIASTQKVTAELEKQRDAAKEIEGSKIANTFGVMGTMLGKIPLLSEFAPGFKAAEEAAREAGAEVTLFSKGMVDASEYSKVKLAEFGPDAKVEGFFGNTEDEVDNLQKAADKAQKKLDK